MALSAFNINDYKEKYRWTGKDSNNDGVQLRILQKSSTAFTVKAIVGLVDMKLTVQGAQGDVFAPIAKTSLIFTLVDAPDLSTTTEKAGDWQEFFTPDSTGYLVQVYREGTVEWQGFITPDSWQESLDFRGAISITARDNIGHCSDIEFNGSGNSDGLATIRSLIEAALDAVEFPMALTANVNSGDCQTLRDSHGYILDSYVCISEFEGKTWGTVLEDLLHSIGYTLRFAGYSTFMLAPIRNIPLGAYTTRASALSAAQTLEFYGGTRELAPAVKQIREKQDYGATFETEHDPFRSLSQSSSTPQTYSGSIVQPGLIPTSFTGRSFLNQSNDGETKGGWLHTRGFINPQNCVGSDTLEAFDGGRWSTMGAMLAADQATAGSISPIPTYRFIGVKSANITLRLEFALGVYLANASTPLNVEPLLAAIMYLKLNIVYTTPGGSIYHWTPPDDNNPDGAWSGGQGSSGYKYDVAEEIAQNYAIDIPIKALPTDVALGGTLDIEFYNIQHFKWFSTGSLYGTAARLSGIKAILNGKSVLKSNIVTTINNDDYNVLLERTPAFGPMSVIYPYFNWQNYPKALWAYSNGIVEPLDYKAYFNGYAAGTAIPIPAQIHKQILCYCYTPMEILGGYCGRPNKAQKLKFGQLCSYKGKYYIIQGGTLDFLTNRLTSAKLHEFIWYAEMWDESSNPSYSSTPEVKTESAFNGANGNSAISGGGESGGGGTGTVTSVALSAPTGFSVSGSPITGAGTLQLSFASGYALPTIENVNKGVTAYGWGNHALAGYLKTAADIAAALGYVPANSVNGLQRPRIKIVRGMADPNSRPAPRLMAEHPLVGSVNSPSDACFVLMVYCKRRGKKAMVDTIQYRDKWGEARGRLATSAALTFTAQAPSGSDPALHLSAEIPLDTLRYHILNNYISLKGEPLPTTMSMSEFKTTNKMARFGRRANFSGTDAQWKAKTHGSRLFGIAVRYTNPEFAGLVGGPLAETTRSINGIPRYIYSDITPIRVTVGQESVPHINLRGESAVKATAYSPNTIGFQLGVGMA